MIPLPSDSRRRLGWLQRLRSHARTIRLNNCGTRLSVRRMRTRRDECWHWRWCWTASHAPRRRLPAAWTVKFYAIGYIAIMREVLRGFITEPLPERSRNYLPSRNARWPSWFAKGPDLAEHGAVRWRRIDLARVIEQRCGVKFAERSVGDLLRRLGFWRISVRPRCPEQDAAIQETHKKTLPSGRGCHASARLRQTDRTLVAG
jgi:hypothetical protein